MGMPTVYAHIEVWEHHVTCGSNSALTWSLFLTLSLYLHDGFCASWAFHHRWQWPILPLLPHHHPVGPHLPPFCDSPALPFLMGIKGQLALGVVRNNASHCVIWHFSLGSTLHKFAAPLWVLSAAIPIWGAAFPHNAMRAHFPRFTMRALSRAWSAL